MNKCENCGTNHDGEYGSGRFCSSKCARGFSTKFKREEINEKVSNIMSGRTLTNEHKINISKNNGKYWQGKDGYWKGKQRPATHNNNYNYAGVRVSKECKICGDIKSILVFGSICNDCKGEFRVYKEKCKFTFKIFDYPDLFNLPLIEKYGMYSASNSLNPNLNGISRDHKISVKYGFTHNIDTEIISHPLNCELIRHTKNQRKNRKCSITLNELKLDIKKWNCARVV